MVEFTSVLAILRGLRSLALSNIFLNQHRSALSFVFVNTNKVPDRRQERGEPNYELHASNMLVRLLLLVGLIFVFSVRDLTCD